MKRLDKLSNPAIDQPHCIQQMKMLFNIESYLKKLRRYYSLLDKNVPVHLLDVSISQYCQLGETEYSENPTGISGCRNELLRAKYDDGEYDLDNEFVREVLVCDILNRKQT